MAGCSDQWADNWYNGNWEIGAELFGGAQDPRTLLTLRGGPRWFATTLPRERDGCPSLKPDSASRPRTSKAAIYQPPFSSNPKQVWECITLCCNAQPLPCSITFFICPMADQKAERRREHEFLRHRPQPIFLEQTGRCINRSRTDD